MTNLLDIISVPNANIIQRSIGAGQYRPLRNHFIDSVSILTSNADGESNHFETNSYASYELHIRPRNIERT